jgi:hypothetical protein
MPTKKPSAQKVSQSLRKGCEKPSPPQAYRAEVATPAGPSPAHPREPTSPVKPDGAVPTPAPKLIADQPPHVELAWGALQDAGFRPPAKGAMVMGDYAWIECRPQADTKANDDLEDRAMKALRRVLGLNAEPEDCQDAGNRRKDNSHTS